MLKLAKYIKKYTGVILLIIVLLVIQANCDLSLPTVYFEYRQCGNSAERY